MDIFTFMHQTNNPESKYRHHGSQTLWDMKQHMASINNSENRNHICGNLSSALRLFQALCIQFERHRHFLSGGYFCCSASLPFHFFACSSHLVFMGWPRGLEKNKFKISAPDHQWKEVIDIRVKCHLYSLVNSDTSAKEILLMVVLIFCNQDYCIFVAYLLYIYIYIIKAVFNWVIYLFIFEIKHVAF